MLMEVVFLNQKIKIILKVLSNKMKLSKERAKFLISGRELRIIYSALLEFSWYIYERLETVKDQNTFKNEFQKEFGFWLDGLGYIENEIIALYKNLEVAYKNLKNIEEEIIFLSYTLVPKKPLIVYTALNECSKNFEDYEIAIRAGITKTALDTVLNDFKRLFPELENHTNK